MKATNRYERWWAAGLIVVGAALLGVVFLSAFSIMSDPGGYYDEWIPAEGPEGPEASFDWEASGGAVDFTDTSSTGDSEIATWAWDFGDGSLSSDTNPSHRFPEEGDYDVTLDVGDNTGVTSQAIGSVTTGTDGPSSGSGGIGMSDLADKAVGTLERTAKGGSVVLLVIGMFVVLTMIGGRFVRQGVRALRPIPDRIKVKLRPKELELSAMEPTPVQAASIEVPSLSLDDTRDSSMFGNDGQPAGSRTG